MIIAPELPSAKPYLLRALFEWCCDLGFTPYVSVFVDHIPQVPQEFVRNNEIILNIGPEATNSFAMTNEAIEFKARFGGVPRDVYIPITHVMALFARENGQGMAFPIIDPAIAEEQPQPMHPVSIETTPPAAAATVLTQVPQDAASADHQAAAPSPTRQRPSLTRIK